MKKFTFFMALIVSCSWLAMPCQAQSLDATIKHIYAPLDKSEISSGILIHQTPLFVPPEKYDGNNRADSIALSLDQFGMLYGQFRGATVVDSLLPHPDIYLSEALGNSFRNDTIKLACMLIEYDKIKHNAEADSLISFNNGQVFDVVGRTESPYQQDTCFALTALHQVARGLSFDFVLPEELIFNNLGWTVDSIAVDFDNGRGGQNITLGTPIKIDYDTSGLKTIQMEITNDGESYLMTTFIDVKESTGGTRGAALYDPESNYGFSTDGMEVSIFPACDDGDNYKIRKPLILVEGFGGQTDKYDMFELLSDAETSNNVILESYFNVNQYDLIWVDYKYPFASIETNADYLIEVIEEINKLKHEDGSSEGNELFGFSMGGMVCKMALLKMHNELEKDSEVENFFSYDAPHKGANYPMGLQAFVRDLEFLLESIGQSTASIQGALQLMDSPAAKELLNLRVQSVNNGGFVVGSGGYDALQNRINSLETIRSLDAVTTHTAISNGASSGTLQESIPSDDPITQWFPQILNFDVQLHEVDGGGLENCYDVELDIKAYWADDQNLTVYERELKIDVATLCSLFGEDITEEMKLEFDAPLSRDNAPGSSTNLGLSDLNTGLQTLLDSLDHVENDNVFFTPTHVMFIPTVSSLNMPEGTDLNTSSPSGGSGIHRWTVSTDNSEELRFSKANEFNQEHVSTNPRISDLIVSELSSSNLTSLGTTLLNGETYNFGQYINQSNTTLPTIRTPDVIENDLIIKDGAELWINKTGNIEYLNSSYPNNDPQTFTVTVPKVNCDGNTQADVVIEDGGKIIVGDKSVSNIGRLFFGKNSTLEVNGKDGIFVDKQSTLGIFGGAQATIESNGKIELVENAKCIISGSDGNLNSKLHVKAGATLRAFKGATIIVENGGILEVDDGAEIELWWNEANIHIKDGGELRINGDMNFDGRGFYQFDEGNILSFGPSVNTIELIGTVARDHRFIRLNKDANLDFGDRDINIEFGKIVYSPGSSIRSEDASIDLWGVTFQGHSSSGTNGIFRAVNPDWIYIEKSWFFDVNTCMEVTGATSNSGPSGEAIKIMDSQIDNTLDGFLIDDANEVLFLSTHFEGVISQAIRAERTHLLKFTSSSIKDYATPSYGILLADDVRMLRMRGSRIDGAQIGVYAPCPGQGNVLNNANVVMEFGSIIENCQTGVQIDKGGTASNNTDYGLFSMRCSKFINNHTAIKGTDILLDIDGCAMTDAACMPNTFDLGNTGTYFFEVYFVDRYANDTNVEIMATNNYWTQGQFGLAYPNPDEPHENYILKRGSSVNSSCQVVSASTDINLKHSDALTSAPINCTNAPPNPGPYNPAPNYDVVMFGGTDYECALTYSDGSEKDENGGQVSSSSSLGWGSSSGQSNDKTIDEEYVRALWYFTHDQPTEALTRFQQIAAVPNATRDNASVICKHDIDVSRIFAQALAGTSASPNNKDTEEQDFNAHALEAWPNPATESVQLFFGIPNFDVYVHDMLGKLYFTESVNDGSSISVGDWPAGIYYVTALEEETNTKQTIKLVVN